MKWSNQKPPGLDDILDRHDSPHTIVGAAVSVVDDRANVQLSDALKRTQEDATALYVHIPFCPSRCLSCDHLTIIEHDHRAIDRYLDSLSTELSLMAQSSRGALLINRVHIGGGSPNYLSDGQMARLMGSIHTALTVSPDAEISMEINPRRTSRSQLELLHGLGVRTYILRSEM
jgi:oxygen-independent coproporphyrinogen-3 oxidase